MNIFDYTCVSRPIMVAMDVTSKCNLKCVHCFNDSGDSAPFVDTSPEVKLNIAKQVAELHPMNVCLCGGETLCCQNLYDVIDILRPNVATIGLVSNGMLLTKEVAKKLKKHGVVLVQISIDGHEAWIHDSFRGVFGSFDKAKSAVQNLVEVGIKQVDVAMVPHKLNFRHFDEYVKLVYSLGASNVRVMPFLPCGRGKKVGRNFMISAEDYFDFCRMFNRLKNVYYDKIDIRWGDPISDMRKMPRNSSIGIKTHCMEIKTNGDIVINTYLPIVVGNCTKKHTLKEYWFGGYDEIWGNKRFLQYVEKIRNVYDIETFEPEPFSGKNICFPLIKISFDGIDHHDFLRNKKGATKEAINAIKISIENGFDTKVQTNINRLNKDTMIHTAKMLDELGVGVMRIIRTTESPRWRENANNATLDFAEYFDTMLDFLKEYISTDCKMDIDIWSFIYLWKNDKTYTSRAYECFDDEYRDTIPVCRGSRGMVAVAANGNLYPCHQLSGQYEKMNIYLGNVKKDGLQKLLKDSDYLKNVCATVKDLKDHNTKCANCKWFKYCCGGCRAIGTALNNDIYGSDISRCIYFNNGYDDKIKKVLKGYELYKGIP